MEERPSFPTERKTWGEHAARHASIAMEVVPSVLFLKPVGIERAETSSRCTFEYVSSAGRERQEGPSLVTLLFEHQWHPR